MSNLNLSVPIPAPQECRNSVDVDMASTPVSPIAADQGNTLVNRRTVYEPIAKSQDTTLVARPKVIRLAPLVDHSQPTPSIARAAVRKLYQNGVIKIGRLERTNESVRPVVYTSKVVSRMHAELVLQEGVWYIRDVGSSSGTFLNNERLSAPSTESTLRQVSTGDVIRFGVDFRGGQEPQFRSIRVRVEIDGGSRADPKEFQKTQFSKLKGLHHDHQHNHEDDHETCAFCLEKMTPNSSLFVAPCCHMWHYKCIRAAVVANYPYFECPLCRKTFDLEEASDDDDDESSQDEMKV